jgi:hypothetical protein
VCEQRKFWLTLISVMRDCRSLAQCITVLLNCSGSAIAKFRGDTLSDQKAQGEFSRDSRCSFIKFAADLLAPPYTQPGSKREKLSMNFNEE